MTYYVGNIPCDPNYLEHFGIKGMKWGVRRYQNEDGTLTAAGKQRYGVLDSVKKKYKDWNNARYEKKVAYGRHLVEDKGKSKVSSFFTGHPLLTASSVAFHTAAQFNSPGSKAWKYAMFGAAVMDDLNLTYALNDVAAINAYENETGKRTKTFKYSGVMNNATNKIRDRIGT